ncbi:hypothetical protein [Algoriphagus sediminis]|uniref:GLPGLI family protein n=1 Tax=Algoriphagus sediminis TaxID=3057113 RepID=A0ABT7Y8K5_9BACT|nr:hypothetical protein [Algoriphagus sediminis]MDN3202813.1 hypothetical protein [Algoriphagus sediminis]
MKPAKPLLYISGRIIFGLAFILLCTLSHGQELYLDGEKAMKKIDELNVGQFTVAFMTSEFKSASTQSRNNFSGAKSALQVNTTGLTQELMQRITDDAYADFVAQAQAKGFTVSDFDGLAHTDESMKRYYPSTGNFKEDVDHYQAYSKLSTITVSANGKPCIDYDRLNFMGIAGKNSEVPPITISYLLGSGYLAAKAKVDENDFLGKIFNQTNVTFYPALQVWWRSGADIWISKSKKAEIKINEHIGAVGAPGELTIADQTDLGSYNRATLELAIDEQKYYSDAMQILKEANTKLINAMMDAK